MDNVIINTTNDIETVIINITEGSLSDFNCTDLDDCANFQAIVQGLADEITDRETAVQDLQNQIDNLPVPQTLADTLANGNNTGGIPIISPNTQNTLTIDDNTITNYFFDGTTEAIVQINDTNLVIGHSNNYNSNIVLDGINGAIDINTPQTNINASTYINSLDGNTYLSVENGDFYIGITDRVPNGAGSEIGADLTNAYIFHKKNGVFVDSRIVIDDNNMLVTDGISNKGLVYAADYSANFTPESLVSKIYVDNATSALTLAEVVANGNTVNGIVAQSLSSYNYLEIEDNYMTLSTYAGGNSNQITLDNYNGNRFYSDIINRFDSPVNEFTNGGIYFVSGIGIDTTATAGTDVLNIGATNANVINYGNASTIHNFLGTAIYELQVNSYVTDKLITLNHGGSVASGIGVGFEIEEAGGITGFLKTNATRDGFSFQAPSIVHTAHFLFSSFTTDRTFDLPDSSGTLSLQSYVDAKVADTIVNGVTTVAPSQNAVFDALELKNDVEVASTTGVALTFLKDQVYGSIGTPETGNITYSSTGAKLGVTNIIIHNHSTAPTFGTNMKKLTGSGDYVINVINYIYVTYINSTEVIYSINQRV